MATSKKTTSKPKAKPGKAATAKASSGNEALHKLFLAGLGLADEVNNKLQATFKDLVKKGKVQEPHLKKAVEDVRKKAIARRKELEKKFNAFTKKNEFIKQRDAFLKSKEATELRKKIQTLEAQVKAAAKKALAAKPVAVKPKAKPSTPKKVIPVTVADTTPAPETTAQQ